MPQDVTKVSILRHKHLYAKLMDQLFVAGIG